MFVSVEEVIAMDNNVKNIKILGFVTLIALMATYVVLASKASGFWNCISSWLPVEFLVALFSGVFGSSFVTVCIEYINYSSSKSKTEDFVYSNTAFLYGKLLIIKNNLEYVLQHQGMDIGADFLDNFINDTMLVVESIRTVNYYPLCKNNFSEFLKSFIEKDVKVINDFLVLCGMLRIAIIKDQMVKLQRLECGVLNNTELVKTATLLHSEIDKVLCSIDIFLVNSDDALSNKYNWRCQKAELEKKLAKADMNIYERNLQKVNV